MECDKAIECCYMKDIKGDGGLVSGTGFEAVQRNKFIFSRPACAEVSNAIQNITGLKNKSSSEQHKEEQKPRLEADTRDMKTINEFFKQHDPFSGHEYLVNIVTGVKANDSVDIDDVFKCGDKILNKMKGKQVSKYSASKSEKAKNLAHSIKIKNKNDEDVEIDPDLLFQRFGAIALGPRKDSINESDVFNYEWTPWPAGLAKSKTELTHADKPSLLSDLKMYTSTELIINSTAVEFVVDGGYLLYALVYYKHGASFSEIATTCCNNMIQRYGQCTVVFDNYPDIPTKKDMVHARRISKKKKTEIYVSANSILSVTREVFLGSLQNKKKFIKVLTTCFIKAGIKVYQASDDADTMISLKALEHAMVSDTVVIGNDTDLIVLLWHFVNPTGKRVYVQDKETSWRINDMIEGEKMQEEILFIHAFLGCDQTSRLFRIPKNRVLKTKKLKGPSSEACKVFNSPSSTRQEIESAGQHFHLKLLSSNETSLNTQRKKVFMQKIGRQLVKPDALPPTTDAANQHYYQVYSQVQEWLGNMLPPSEWGWQVIDSKLVPIMMTLPPGPSKLLKYVFCACKMDGCSTNSCSCR